MFLHGQLVIPPPQPYPVDQHPDIRSDNGRVPGEAGNRAQEVAEQHHDAVELDAEPYERPLEQDQEQAGEEGRRALGLLLAREEEERLLGANDDGEADEEEDLFGSGC